MGQRSEGLIKNAPLKVNGFFENAVSIFGKTESAIFFILLALLKFIGSRVMLY